MLFEDRTATQRAQATHTHPDTVRTFTRRFRQQGMLGLLPAAVAVGPRGSASRVPEAVRQELARLKALFPDFQYRELARLICCTCGYRLHHTTVKQLWHQSPVATQQHLERWDYPSYPERYEARRQVIKLYYQG